MKYQKTAIILIYVMMVGMTMAADQSILPDGRMAPRLLNYQGYLTDTLGIPVTNPAVSMTFAIFDAVSAGNQKWSETQTSVSVNRGIFHVLLGSVTPIPDSVFLNSTNRWLELTVSGQTLSPRTRIVSAGYAYTATYSDTSQYSRNAVPDNDWNFLISDGADTTLQMGGRWGLARVGNVMYGNADSTHVNLGVACTTGTVEQNYKYCTVGGGSSNCASIDHTTVGGGDRNSALHYYATVGGGIGNTASGSRATVGGGQSNSASGSSATVGGGYENNASGHYSTVSGGYANTISANADYSYLFGINSNLTQDSTFMVDVPHTRFGTEATGYEFPRQRGADGQVMVTNASGQLSWTASTGDNDWVISGSNIYSGVSGDVGIGTTTPTAKLEIQQGNSSDTLLKLTNGNLAGPNASTLISMKGINDVHNVTLDIKTANIASSMQYIALEANGTQADRLVLQPEAGNVGIGATYPGAKLHVAGHIWQTSTGQSVFLGEGAGFNDDLSNNNNVFVGYYSGNSNTYGMANTGCGYRTLYSNTTAGHNIAIGERALYTQSYDNSGNNWNSFNIAIGDSALYNNQPTSTMDGVFNTALGHRALRFNTTGTYNTASGYMALYSNTTGDYNVASGYQALYSNTTGGGNTASGYMALYSNIDGVYNTASGYMALYSNTTGNYNVASGNYALYANTTGSSNIASGYQALYSNTTAGHNIAIGLWTLYTQSYNNSNTPWNSLNIAIGENALYNNQPTSTVNGVFNTAIGHYALFSNTIGYFNTACGYGALNYNSTGNYNTAAGYNSGPTGTNFANTSALGYNAVPTANNRVHIGNTSIAWIGGQVIWSTYSDARAKSDVRDNIPGLEFITRLKPVSFNWNTKALNALMGVVDTAQWSGKYDIEKKRISGFLAQDVARAARECGYDFSGIDSTANVYSLSYAQFVVPLVKAVQEQQTQIKKQQAEIEELKMQIKTLLGRK